MIAALLALGLPVLADTGVTSCRDWSIVPDSVTATSGMDLVFRIDTARSCQVGLECAWSMSQDLGTLSAAEGFSITWMAPHEPPVNCISVKASLTATCTLWGEESRSSTADITFRCTDQQREDLEEERNAHSPQGGGCGSPGSAQALLLLPLGLWGLRRRLVRSCTRPEVHDPCLSGLLKGRSLEAVETGIPSGLLSRRYSAKALAEALPHGGPRTLEAADATSASPSPALRRLECRLSSTAGTGMPGELEATG
jgi:hypothetical protein